MQQVTTRTFLSTWLDLGFTVIQRARHVTWHPEMGWVGALPNSDQDLNQGAASGTSTAATLQIIGAAKLPLCKSSHCTCSSHFQTAALSRKDHI